jgi:hypothetical protein
MSGKAPSIMLCYEAGYDAFWLVRFLQARGIECLVVDAASMQVNRCARSAKSKAFGSFAKWRPMPSTFDYRNGPEVNARPSKRRCRPNTDMRSASITTGRQVGALVAARVA